MIDNLESSYDCSHAGNDLKQLQDELQSLQVSSGAGENEQEQRNRLENQIRFIKNKCDIRP